MGLSAAAVSIGLMAPASDAAGGGCTTAQVTSGASTDAAQCSQYRGAQLQGGAGPALTGASFRTSINASYTTAGKLYDFTSKQLPASAPGSLTPKHYADVVALVLQRKGFPPNGTTLTAQNASALQLPGKIDGQQHIAGAAAVTSSSTIHSATQY